ncbi:MAG: DUF370 domain-containing protein [Ruminococcaceae bacterium]|nr:DUF370 domain-containing protein [Oscillospiraceae bacterium]
MYLHVGNNKSIREKNIIGIFDTDNASMSPQTRKYLVDAEKEGMLEAASNEIPKSFIVYSDKESDFADRGKFKICFSQLSSSALLGRIKNLNS